MFVFKLGVDEGMEEGEGGEGEAHIFYLCLSPWNLNVVSVEKAGKESTRKIGPPQPLNVHLHGQQKPRNPNSWFYWHIHDPSPCKASISSRFLSKHQEKYVPLLPGQNTLELQGTLSFSPQGNITCSPSIF